MTAETLKPFIPQMNTIGTTSYPNRQTNVHLHRKTKIITTILSGAAFALAIILLILAIWNTVRVRQLESELTGLKRVVDMLQQRLGLQYLDEADEFEKEYEKALIEDPNKFDDSDLIEDELEEADRDTWTTDDYNDGEDDDNDNDDDDEDEDDDYSDYRTMIDNIKKAAAIGDENERGDGSVADAKKNSQEQQNDSSNVSANDNVFDDFNSYNNSKLQRDRKSRSISEIHDDKQQTTMLADESKTTSSESQRMEFVSDPSADIHRSAVSPLRKRTTKRRRIPLTRSGESSISAKTVASLTMATPAAHFHLNRKVAHHNAAIRMDSYRGDMYIGHATSTSSNSLWQQHFSVTNGLLTVHEPGLYYVYAQICYNNTHDQNGFIIFHGHKPFLQCLNTVPTSMPNKVHTCHTSGLIHLQENETIHLRDIHADRNVMLRDDNNRSYFGLIKV